VYEREGIMDIKMSKKDRVTVVEISGNLDGNSAPQLQEKVLPLIDELCCLVLDLSECKYISSAGLRVLLMIAKSASVKEKPCALSGLCEEVRDVMEMTGFSSFFKSYNDIKSACEAIKKKGGGK